MRKVEAFCGVRVLTYAVLGNHFHILLHVPAPQPVSDDLFRERLLALYDKGLVERTMRHIDELREKGCDEAAEEIKAPYVARMCELSAFGKTLKQRFSQSYNRRHGRKGTLWEARFRSLLVEGSRRALSAVAAYIDLNAVRAGIVGKPAAYRFCGYGEAVRGSRHARRGLGNVVRPLGSGERWSAAQAEYCRLLHVQGPQSHATPQGGGGKQELAPEQLRATPGKSEPVSLQQALRGRVRHFSDGVILGSRAYIESALRRYWAQFGLNPIGRASSQEHAELGGLCTAQRVRRRHGCP
jgi:hypothetical protein